MIEIEYTDKSDDGGNLEWLIYAVPIALGLMCIFVIGYQCYLRKSEAKTSQNDLSTGDNNANGTMISIHGSSKKKKKNIVKGDPGTTPGFAPSVSMTFSYSATPGQGFVPDGDNNNIDNNNNNQVPKYGTHLASPGSQSTGVTSTNSTSAAHLITDNSSDDNTVNVGGQLPSRPQINASLTTDGMNININMNEKQAVQEMEVLETNGYEKNGFVGEGGSRRGENVNDGAIVTEGEMDVALEMAYTENERDNINCNYNKLDNDETVSGAIGIIRKAIIRAKRELNNMNQENRKMHLSNISKLLNIINQESLDYSQRLKIIQIDKALKDSKPQEYGNDLLEILQTMTL